MAVEGVVVNNIFSHLKPEFLANYFLFFGENINKAQSHSEGCYTYYERCPIHDLRPGK